MLHCNSVTMRFGGTVALKEVDLDVERGELVGLLGPNGSGKTTLINVVSGFYKPTAGEVVIDGLSANGRRPHDLRLGGVARTFQNLRLFESLSVLDNMLIGLHTEFVRDRSVYGRWSGSLLGTRKSRFVEREASRKAFAQLERVGLKGLASHRVKDLPYGMKKRLEMARALAVEPKLLLLDEPTAGLVAEEATELMELFAESVTEQGLAVLLIEHRLEWVLNVCSRVAVLDAGVKIADGEPEAVAADAAVIRAYVGE
jgi:ABC-type branched-subunit amino acid transport system ATPase component